MKKRLGTVPRGLEWISQEIEEQEVVVPASKLTDLSIPAAKRGLQQDLIRATFIMRQDYLEKIKAFAYWERIQIKEVVEEMCNQFFEGKKVRSIPQKHKE
ncbi:hypothetical protein HYV10_01695 [Candidatus Dependentiae bacterium]|nr:hypothetical protein [Candidatus Dependentiae bacterium]